MSSANKEHGEGNYKASRQYNEATKKFVESGKVERAARDAAPDTERERAEMANAEAEGRRRAKEEDPALRDGSSGASKDRRDDPRGKPIGERSAEGTTTPGPGEERG